MELDGNPVTVAFALSPDHGEMSLAAAKRIVGIDAANLKPVTASNGQVLYQYPFRSLSINGVTIANPKTLLNPERPDCSPHWHLDRGGIAKCYGSSDVVLGMASRDYGLAGSLQIARSLRRFRAVFLSPFAQDAAPASRL